MQLDALIRDTTVMVVESDPDLMHVLRYHLEKAGLEVIAAAAAGPAIDHVSKRPVDLVVTEAHLPDMHAMLMRKRMFMSPDLRDVPFLLLAETAPRDGETMLFRAGLDEWIRKPFDPLHVLMMTGCLIARRVANEEILRLDPLTRLLNRVSFELEVGRDLMRLNRYQRQASLAVIDIDAFTNINETHGYAIGDLVFSAMASTITANIRSVDWAGRHSGGHFGVYMPETDAQGAHVLLERTQRACSVIQQRRSSARL